MLFNNKCHATMHAVHGTFLAVGNYSFSWKKVVQYKVNIIQACHVCAITSVHVSIIQAGRGMCQKRRVSLVLSIIERERQVYLQPDGLDSNTYNTYNINIIKYLQYGRHTGTTNICLLPIVQSPWY